MKRIKIIKNGVVTNQAELSNAEADAWLASCLSKNKFGKSERWLPVQQDGTIPGEDLAQAVDSRTVKDAFGKDVVEKKFLAQFQVVEEDMTAEVAALEAKKLSLASAAVELKKFDKTKMKADEVAQLIEYILVYLRLK